MFNNADDIKEKSSLCWVVKTMQTTKSVFFGYPGNREKGWQGNPARRTSACRNILCMDFCSCSGD